SGIRRRTQPGVPCYKARRSPGRSEVGLNLGQSMRRRTFIAGLAGTLAQSVLTQAEQVQQVPVVGFLHPGFPDSANTVFDALRDGWREVGYVEGETIRVEARWAHGNPQILPDLVRELVRLRVTILVAAARPSVEAAIAATKEVPIIANDLESDPVASGYVASL